MLHTKMCNVRIYVTHEHEMFSVRTYENIICPNLCYTRKYDVWCDRTYVTMKMCNVHFQFFFFFSSEFGPLHK